MNRVDMFYANFHEQTPHISMNRVYMCFDISLQFCLIITQITSCLCCLVITQVDRMNLNWLITLVLESSTY